MDVISLLGLIFIVYGIIAIIYGTYVSLRTYWNMRNEYGYAYIIKDISKKIIKKLLLICSLILIVSIVLYIIFGKNADVLIALFLFFLILLWPAWHGSKLFWASIKENIRD